MKKKIATKTKQVALCLMLLATLIYFYMFFCYDLPLNVHLGILSIVLLFYIGIELLERDVALETKATKISKIKNDLTTVIAEKNEAIEVAEACKQSQKIYESKYNEIVENRNKLVELVRALEEKIKIQEKNFQRELAHAKLDAELDARENAIIGGNGK